MFSNHFTYSHCLIRGLPLSFQESLKQHPPLIPIDVPLAKQQHEQYTQIIKSLFPNTTIEVNIDENHPDCCFIEDTAIVIGKMVIISYMGALERRGEERPVSLLFKGLGDFMVKEMSYPGTMDGGDILFVGNDLLVGLSVRTNIDALNQLRRFLEGKVNIYSIPVTDGLHLKSSMSGFDETTIIVAQTSSGEAIVEEMKKYQELVDRYTFVFVPDFVSSNVLRINNTLIIQEGFPKSEEVLLDLCLKKGVSMVKLNMSELIKADGALTCCSIPFLLN